jgi:membrane fusion protein (multidrug efflux system)
MDDVRKPLPAQIAEKAGSAVDTPPARGKLRAFATLFLVFALLGGSAGFVWLQNRGIESTDDAYIDAHISQVAAQIAGRVIAVPVQDNQVVAAGDELLRIDPRDAQVKLDQALAQQAQAAAQRDQTRATLNVREADLAQAAANVRVAQADLVQAQQDYGRYRAINPRAITRQLLDSSTATLRGAEAKLEANRQSAAGMRAQLVAMAAQVKASEAALQSADADVANARLQLSYTHILAPAPGRVTRRTVEVGNYVNPGQALLSIVQPGMWVTANFKETQLGQIRPGQKAKIHVDAFPDANLDGHVESLQAGTGSIFSALPAENATGNYVKIVQRLPVKIVFDGDAAQRLPLAPGMSVAPRVDVR